MTTPRPIRWDIAGAGVAGRARGRAILADPDATLVRAWRGDPAALGVEAAPEFDALLRDDIDAVAICTPDDTHPDFALRALRADKHVVCEYPLAGNRFDAARLYDLAASRARILHTEHIELLSGTARWLRGRVLGRKLLGGSVRFTGSLRPNAFGVAHANIARLQRLIDVVGEPGSLAVRFRDEHHLQAVLHYSGNPDRYDGMAEVHVDFSHGPDLTRRTEMVLELSDGTLMQLGRTILERGIPVKLPSAAGLFAADHATAMACIRGTGLPYADRERVILGLTLADRLAGAPVTGGLQRRGLPMREL
ncbi:MAG: Gfo/Idh/MocA family oxidoreductase [Myxococcota bacterium]|nr:Gfo/Idh/MocA family oxidoreductase [Myxococcota bacterium]